MNVRFDLGPEVASSLDRLLSEVCLEQLAREKRDLDFWQRAAQGAHGAHHDAACQRMQEAGRLFTEGLRQEQARIASVLVRCADPDCDGHGWHRAIQVAVAGAVPTRQGW